MTETYTTDMMSEAATHKSRARAAINALSDLLNEKELPKGLKDQIENLRSNMRKTWQELADDAKYDPVAEAKEVIPVSSACLIESEFVPLTERAIRPDGTALIKLIAPGWGSSGYYPAETLQRDAGVFAPGTKLYWNHPTRTEEAERPERSLDDLAGEMLTPARWGDGPVGPGLYADVKVFEKYAPAVDELAPYIGMSIRAAGEASPGEAEGKRGAIINRITGAASVDFVTSPGAGGKVVTLFESIRESKERFIEMGQIEDLKAENELLKAKLAELTAQMGEMEAEAKKSKAEAKKAEEAARVVEAQRILESTLAKYEMTGTTRIRLTETLKPGAELGDDWSAESYERRCQEAAKAELAYLAEVTQAAGVRGMGISTPPAVDYEKQLTEAMDGILGNKQAAEIAAKGRR